jgi:iron complex transport system substrate-binding protein
MSGIVTLLPAATEIVCALGLRDRLVGRSHECDFPPGVDALPALTRARVDGTAASADIDREVREMLAAGGPLYDVDERLLAELRPDVVVTQEACEVCAVSYEQVAACMGRIAVASTIVSLGPSRLEDVIADLRRVARTCGVDEAGARVEAELRDRLRRAAAGTTASGPRDRTERARPRVAVVEWLDPPMLAGHWVPDVIEAAGGVAVGVPAGEPSRYATWEEIESLRPDFVVVAPCGFDRARGEREGGAMGRSTARGGAAIVRRRRQRVPHATRTEAGGRGGASR